VQATGSCRTICAEPGSEEIGSRATIGAQIPQPRCRVALNWRPTKTWGPVDARGHAMFGCPMEEEAKIDFTITVNWRRKDGSFARPNWGRLTAALAARPKMWVCNSRTPSQFSGGYKRLWSANNCSATAKLYGRVLAVIIVAI
jgi:hypothetical protein